MSFGDWLKKASPIILTILGAAGTVGTAVMAVKATPDALTRRNAAQDRKGEEKLTLLEAVKAEAPAYIPAAAIGIGTIGCIFGANFLNQKQQASLASAYALLDQTYKKYKGKVKSLFGEAGDYMVEKAIKQDEEDAENDRPPWDEVQTFYFEPYGKFFERTMEQVFRAEYALNHDLASDRCVTINDFLDHLELDHVDGGNDFGWNLYDGECFYNYNWIEFEHRYFVTDDGLTVCSIDMPNPPHISETQYSDPRNNQPV